MTDYTYTPAKKIMQIVIFLLLSIRRRDRNLFETFMISKGVISFMNSIMSNFVNKHNNFSEAFYFVTVKTANEIMQLIRFESYIAQNCLKRTLKKFPRTLQSIIHELGGFSESVDSQVEMKSQHDRFLFGFSCFNLSVQLEFVSGSSQILCF